METIVINDFIGYDAMEEKLRELYKDSLDECEAAKYESTIETYAEINAGQIVEDMHKYVHQKSTKIYGNFCNIREDWEYLPEFIGSEVQPWGKFDDVVKSIDDGTISEEDLEKFQTWCRDWFFTAFGTYGLCYNFQTLISELEWEEEHEKTA